MQVSWRCARPQTHFSHLSFSIFISLFCSPALSCFLCALHFSQPTRPGQTILPFCFCMCFLIFVCFFFFLAASLFSFFSLSSCSYLKALRPILPILSSHSSSTAFMSLPDPSVCAVSRSSHHLVLFPLAGTSSFTPHSPPMALTVFGTFTKQQKQKQARNGAAPSLC